MDSKLLSTKRSASPDGIPAEAPLSKKLKTSSPVLPLSSVHATGRTLVWFKKDLRIQDNPALYRASVNANELYKDSPQAGVIALYVISPSQWKAHNVAPVQVDFILRNLQTLRESLDKLNIPLVIKNVDKRKDIPQAVASLCKELHVASVYFNREYELNEFRRDILTADILEHNDIKVTACHDQCIIPPGTLKTKEGKTYTVYSPFKNSWFREVKQSSYLSISPSPIPNSSLFRDQHKYLYDQTIPKGIPNFIPPQNVKTHADAAFPAGEAAATARLADFIESRMRKYHNDRDFPIKTGTSSLSPYLALGIISARQCVAKAKDKHGVRLEAVSSKESASAGIITWIQELIWRDFYRDIMAAFPRICMYKPFKLNTDSVQWQDDEEGFKRWCEGRTGYPIVDAAMRQLNATGWMHNRLRMITASFLSKHLLVDWRKGEKYFSQHLIDGDLASNNGGWQWAASTGTDAQPYFRVFNPLLQSQKFDASGEFIRKWVPELKSMNSKQIHDPYGILQRSAFEKLGYPKPVVEHSFARTRAIDAYKAVSKKSE